MRAFAFAVALTLLPSVAGAQSASEVRSARPAWPWALVGVGGAMFVAAAITGGLALDHQATLDGICAPHSCPPSAEALQLEGRALAFSTDALWVGGLVVATLGVVLALTLPDEPTVASAACGPDGCGFTVRGSF